MRSVAALVRWPHALDLTNTYRHALGIVIIGHRWVGARHAPNPITMWTPL